MSEFIANYGIFAWFLIIGFVLAIVSILIIDLFDALDGILFEGFPVVVSFGTVGMGLAGIISINVGATSPYIIGFIAGFAGLLVSLTVFFSFRKLRRSLEQVDVPTTSEDIVGVVGKVIWWSGDVGEIVATVKGSKEQLKAKSSEKLTAGNVVTVVSAVSNGFTFEVEVLADKDNTPFDDDPIPLEVFG